MRLVIYALFSVVFWGLFVGEPVSATWWTGNEDIIWEGTADSREVLPWCSGSYERIDLRDGGSENACVYGRIGNNRVASYIGKQGSPRYAIISKLDATFLPIMLCGGEWGCVYSGTYDTLFVSTQQGVVAYEHFSRSFSQYSGGETGGIDGELLYSAASTPRIFLSPTGQQLLIDGSSGVVVVDVLSRENTYYPSGGYVEDYFGAVSDDGETIVFVDLNGAATFYSKETCGADDSDTHKPHCQPSTISPWNSEPIFDGIYPTFSDDGGRLTYYGARANGESRIVTLQTFGYRDVVPLVRVDYLALGDSFSSGQGETDDSYYQPFTNDEFDTCHVSTRSYAYLLGSAWGLYTKNVACSGAVVADIAIGSSYDGQGGRLGSSGKGLDSASVTAERLEAVDSFIPGRVEQAIFVGRYLPEVVTLGVGGNDIGFATKISACLGPGTCNWASDLDMRLSTAKEIGDLYAPLVAVLRSLKERSPDTAFIVVGYPQIISATGECRLSTRALFNEKERRYISESITYLNAVLRAAANVTGFVYGDTSQSFVENNLCSNTEPSAMNAIRFGDDVSVIEKLPKLRVVGTESFHPTPHGHQLLFSTLKGSFTSPPTKCVDCRLPDAGVPQPSDYWGPPEAITASVRQRPLDLMQNSHIQAGDILNISVPPGTLAPQAPVRVEVRSSPQQLWGGFAEGDGSLSVGVEGVIEPGVHTLSVISLTPTGDEMRLYQTIFVSEKTPIVTRTDRGEMLYFQQVGPRDDHVADLSSEVGVGLSQSVISEMRPSVLGARQDSSMSKISAKDNDKNNARVVVLITTVILLGLGILLVLRRLRPPG